GPDAVEAARVEALEGKQRDAHAAQGASARCGQLPCAPRARLVAGADASGTLVVGYGDLHVDVAGAARLALVVFDLKAGVGDAGNIRDVDVKRAGVGVRAVHGDLGSIHPRGRLPRSGGCSADLHVRLRR